MKPAWVAPLSPARRQALARALTGEPVRQPVEPAAASAAPAFLETAIAGRLGLVTLEWPGVRHPIWLRAGSQDADELTAAMADVAGALALPFIARRIVEIGAGAGFRTVALAAAHQEATITSIEPIPTQARLHSLNTLPWRQIIGIRAVVAESAAEFGHTLDPATGRPTLVAKPGGGIGAINPAALLAYLKWDNLDLLVIEPAACPDLAAPGMAPTLRAARLVAIAGADPATLAALQLQLSETTHEHRQRGPYTLFLRRDDPPPAPKRRVYLFDCGGAPVPWQRHDIAPEPWAYFPIGDTGFRLHPNPPGTAPPRLLVRHDLAGPRRFEAILRVNHSAANPVRFRVRVIASPTGQTIADEAAVIGGGEQRNWGFDMPLTFGAVDIEFATEMAGEGANGFAWAEWLEPGFI